MRRIIAGMLGVLLMLAMAGPASASTIGTIEFLYDDDGDPTDGIDSGGADGVDTSGLWSVMDLEITDNTLDGSYDQIEIGLSALDPDPTSGTVDYYITKVAFLFDMENAELLVNSLLGVLDSTTEGNLGLNWSIEYIHDGSTPGGDGLPEPTNGVGDPVGALIVDFSLSGDCVGVKSTCGLSPEDWDTFSLLFVDGSLEGLMLADIFDFAYIRGQAVVPESINGDGSFLLGGEIQEIPLPPAIALFGSGILFLFGFVGLRRRSTTG